MEQRALKPADLVGIIGDEAGVYELVNGQRDISKEQALILGSFFMWSRVCLLINSFLTANLRR
ncbi:hypothetical protein [Planktothrix agardhii]|uniref:hypothetical protein n=1 Tax=Planktothrix agardhii TaxID=1160 RepID=UPI0004130A33|nr:hypothetical protein [Planktothrix agardhii]